MITTAEEATRFTSWLRAQVEARRKLAMEACGDHDPVLPADGQWHTGCQCEGECTGYPVCEGVLGDHIRIYSEGGHDAWQAEHIAANDPCDVLARCEFELALLDEHYILTRGDTNERYEEFSIIPIGGFNAERGCIACHYVSMGAVKAAGVCVTVRLLGMAYRHWPGYQEEWQR